MTSPRSRRDIYLSLPNFLSYVRVVLIPLVMVLIGLQSPVSSPKYNPTLAYVAAIVFVLTGITDLFDGYLARRMKLTSVFGKFVDPLADKLIHMAVFIMLIPLGEIPAWLVVVFLFREISVTALRGIAIGEGVVIPADVWGKKKTALLNIALTCFLLPPMFLGLINSRVVGWFSLGLALVVSVGSGIHYFLNFFHEALENKKKSGL